MPGGKFTTLYRPSSPVTVSRTRSISAGLAISTFAPDTLAPDESSTSPAIVPEFVPPWPQADPATSKDTASTYPRTRPLFIVPPHLCAKFENPLEKTRTDIGRSLYLPCGRCQAMN